MELLLGVLLCFSLLMVTVASEWTDGNGGIAFGVFVAILAIGLSR